MCVLLGDSSPVALIKNGRRERLPYEILKTTAFAVAVIAGRGFRL